MTEELWVCQTDGLLRPVQACKKTKSVIRFHSQNRMDIFNVILIFMTDHHLSLQGFIQLALIFTGVSWFLKLRYTDIIVQTWLSSALLCFIVW